MPKDVMLEGFSRGPVHAEQRYRGLGDLSLELSRIWGFPDLPRVGVLTLCVPPPSSFVEHASTT